jgi:hypothetical protein
MGRINWELVRIWTMGAIYIGAALFFFWMLMFKPWEWPDKPVEYEDPEEVKTFDPDEVYFGRLKCVRDREKEREARGDHSGNITFTCQARSD